MQDVTAAFKSAAETGQSRQVRARVKIAWERNKDETLDFAVIGTSTIDGNDIIQGELTDITEPDLFQYTDETESLLSLAVDRRILEPLGGMAYTLGDLMLENTDARFTPQSDATIGDYILPNRPVKLFAGFRFGGVEKTIPLMYGVSEQPKEDKNKRNCTSALFDYISYINDYKLESSMYTDQRSDQIIADILDTIGFTSDQYEMDTGLNTIDFAWFGKGTKAGDAIREICEAEEGFFYQDELGMLRFENRRHYLESPHATSQHTFDKEDISSYEVLPPTKIINRCIVSGQPRSEEAETEIWRSGQVVELAPKESKEIWASFEDPVTDISAITEDTDYIANSAEDNTGTDQTDDVSATVQEFAKSAKITLTNALNSTTYVTLLRLRGTPAVITSEIEEIYEDSDSQDIYGIQQYEVENDYIDTSSFAYYLARAMVRKYATPARQIKIEVPAQPHLQLRDKVTVEDLDLETTDTYRIMRIQLEVKENGMFRQILHLREITDFEADSPAVVGTSTIDGDDIVWI
jgi:hypothetical protein